MFVAESDGLYAVAADNINNAAQIFARMQYSLHQESVRTFGSIFECIHGAVRDYHFSRIKKEIIYRNTLLFQGTLRTKQPGS
jgi:hypothetical protein